MKISKRQVEGECWVVDGVFEPVEVSEFHAQLVARRDLSFSGRASDSATPLLFANFVKDERLAPPQCSRMRSVVEDLVDRKLIFDRGQINYTLHGDQRLIHRDEGTDLTVLYYANPEWKPDWLGETLIYDQSQSEVLAAVTPRPGRFVAFTSNVPHRVGVPSKTCVIPRIGVVARYLLA